MAHCHSNAMFAAPASNAYGATYYGAAAISETLGGGNWMASGCGKCWKVTGTGVDGAETTLVLKGTNFCPPSNAACNGKAHFDIAAPGFDVLAYSQSHTCPEREPDEAAGELGMRYDAHLVHTLFWRCLTPFPPTIAPQDSPRAARG